jgi:dolichol-phosphate mannosyltransferase
MNSRIQLSVIIPAYYEEDNLRIILPRLKYSLDGLKEEYEVLVIGPLHTFDSSENICNTVGMNYLKRECGDSYGDAVRTGIKFAKGEYIIFMDADGSHTPEFITNLYKYRKEYDVVIASRYVKGGGSENSRILKFMSFIVNLAYSGFLNLSCKDVSNGFKLYKKTHLESLNLVSKNFDIIEEILYKLKRSIKSLKILEIPYFFKGRLSGRSKRNLIIFTFSYLFTLIRLRMRK